MLKYIIAAFLLSVASLAHAKPIGLAVVGEDTAFILTDEACPADSPIKNFPRRFVLAKKDVKLSGCYSLLGINEEIGYLVLLYINEEKLIVALPLNSFQVIQSIES